MQQIEYVRECHKVQSTDSSPTSHMRVDEHTLFEYAVIQARNKYTYAQNVFESHTES